MVDSHTGADGGRIAMLIDGDSAQASLLGEMIAEAGRYGSVTIRRIYGDWTKTSMKSWRDILSDHAILPVQQFRYTTGKNATDSAMIIDAMDILYEGAVQGFCLVSSDSDFTGLATRIREKGLFVMGIGQKITPKAFVKACEVFVYTENLRPEPAPPPAPRRATQKAVLEPVQTDPRPLLRKAFDLSLQEGGWALLGMVGERIRQLDPAFDSRTYGHRQLSQLIRSYPDEFEMRDERSSSGSSVVFIRLKDERPR